ncbi:serine hydrolase domain-containing protein [Streptomyces rubradiris]|uniref:Esterase n=1 Tax=Streptomyces rubradiris TaxID=285531 RepID=A0ABQ3RI14_STRRR|nr:serine hydrolase domain-containing protein [Streptomyces rubradiris]GHH29029.1 esterase [Streptomyces rubradiris]GHI55455.1 esterase [Streptomyces rubradiris]
MSEGSGFPQGGSCDSDFAEVARVFRGHFAAGEEIGAAVCVYHRGRPVADLWGGFADPERTDPWRPATLGVLASPTKALAASAALLLVDRGVLELDRPIADYWPEFAAHGKERITLRMVLSHRSGVVCLDHDPITADHMRRHTPIAEALAAARPEWEPDTAHGYHAVTFGYLVSELVRRCTGRTVGAFFAEEIAAPLGLDCHIGLPDPDAVHLATMVQSKAEDVMSGGDPGDAIAMLVELGKPDSLTHRSTVASMALDPEPDLTAEDPSYGGWASAQSLARLYAALLGEVDGFRLISERTSAQIGRVHARGACRITMMSTAWGLGFMLPDSPTFPAAAGLTTAFGFDGANGTFTFADPRYDLAFAYVQNSGSRELGSIDDRAQRLVRAVYSSVEGRSHKEES